MAVIGYDIEIDWHEANQWVCPFCGGEIDHLCQEDDNEAGYSDDSYKCQEPKGWMCEQGYMMVRWSHAHRGNNGDAKTLKRWIQVEVDEKYLSKNVYHP